MSSTIAAVTTSGGGIIMSGDSSGNLSLLSGATTVVAVTSTGVAVTGTLSASGALTTAAIKEDATGNLGLGIVPTAGGATTNIEIGPYGSTIASRNNASAPQLYISSNAVGQGYSPTYKINGFATQYVMQGFSGVHTWSTAPSGIAGNAITFTERMSLSSTGLAVTGLVDISAATSGQIKFPATQNASANANTLDDYEEGTWTPNQGSGLTVVGAFSSSGNYVKVGKVVTLNFSLSGATSITTGAAGTAITTNLPFTTGSVYASGTLSGTSNVGYAVFNTYDFSANSGGSISGNSTLKFSITYITS
jgi:hypothetical protein